MTAEDRIRQYLADTEETKGDLIDAAYTGSRYFNGIPHAMYGAELNRTDLHDVLNELEALRRGESRWRESERRYTPTPERQAQTKRLDAMLAKAEDARKALVAAIAADRAKHVAALRRKDTIKRVLSLGIWSPK